MSTISSKQGKRQGFVDPNFILGFLVLIIALLVFTPLTGNIYNPLSTVLGAVDSTHASVSTSVNYSFSADQRYWGTNCSHGWSSNSACDDIVSRAQSCSISVDSAYCSEYDTYLKQFSN
jgi:hypothetical protein